MTYLSDRDITGWRTGHGLVIDPMAYGALQPASVDLRLGPELKIAQADGRHHAHRLDVQGPYLLARGVFVLAATLEHIEIPNGLVGILVGKSSRAREGYAIEDAGFVDPGWRGNLTLELDNRSPMPRLLIHGMPICQLRFALLSTPALHPYGTAGIGRYQGSTGPVESRAVVGGQP